MRKTAFPRLLALGFLALWSVVAPPVYARGQIEERISLARQLIADNNLNEAELLLVEIEREDPDRQDEVEEMRMLIRTSRRGYNDQYAELIRIINTPGSEDQAVDIIRRLEALDSNPNPATARLIFEAKRTVLFKQSERRFNELMEQALALLNNGQYLEAVQLYLTGFEIHREIFEEESYSEITKASIIRSLTIVENSGQVFLDPAQGFAVLTQQGTALASATNASAANWQPLLGTLGALSDLYWEASGSLEDMREQDALLTQAAGLARGDPYLTFMNAVISGRDLSGKTEGLLGAMRRYWDAQINAWTQTLGANLDRELSAGLAALTAGNFAASEAAYSRAANLAASGRRIVPLWNRWIFSAQGLRPGLEEELAAAAALNERFAVGSLTATQGVQLARLRQQLAPTVATPPAALEALNTAAALSRQSRTQADAAVAFQQGLPQRQAALAAAGVTAAVQPPVGTLAAWQAQAAFFQNAEVDFYSRRAALAYPPLDAATVQVETDTARAQALAAGTPSRSPEGLEYTARNPRDAAALFTQTAALAQRTRTEVETFLSDFRAITEQVGNAPALVDWINRGSSLLARLDDQLNASSAALPQAQAQANEAASLLTRARADFAAAQSANAQERYQNARESLASARTLWNSSFLLQDDPAVQSGLEQQAAALATAIQNGERAQVAREVRTLIDQGRQAYQASRFANAEEVLLRARDRWADTEPEPNVEVEFWLGQTRTALTFSSGRELSRTDPLYFEIQPLLNFAVQDYERARELFALERRVEGNALLARATARLEQVRIPFPLNQTAGVLQLRILQLSATKAEFDSEFERQFQSAVSLGANREQAGNALAALQDLAQIQPNYPGIQAQIRRLRVVVGLDPPPPNPADLARSSQLAAQAQTIANSNVPSQFARGLALSQEALRLNPNNAQAQRLLDFFLINGPRTGTAAALTPAERSSLDQAATLVNQGRFSEAKVLVDRLLAIPKNRTNQEIVRLQSIISSRLRL